MRRWNALVIRCGLHGHTHNETIKRRLSVMYLNVHILRHLKEELAWTEDKWLQVISNV